MGMMDERTKIFRESLESLGRDQLLELVELQDPELRAQVHRAEWVFEEKLQHLSWSDGTPILGRPLTNRELAMLIDEPFNVNPELSKIGLSIVEQRQLHIANDTVLWGKEFLGAEPHIFQILILRDPSLKKVLRAGRRLGKTWSMGLLALHYAYTTNNGRVIVLTPMKTQGALIYEQILKFIEDSPTVGQSITRNVASPQYEINLSNGATIRFFSTGMKSGGKSDVTRGQEAHVIILDELDYMGDDDLEAVLAMMTKTAKNQKPKQMIGASTPTGRHSTFWRWCTDTKSQFREFWFPSYCNPEWDAETEDFFREEYTEMGYRHEIEADWGEDVDGVFPRKYVDMAFSGNEWDYELNRVNQDTFYVMGVDWDKYGAGTNIVCLEVFPRDHANAAMRGKYRVCYREETKKDEYLLLKAMDRIIQLHERFHFRHIYIDRGYGEVQVEYLHKYGQEHPETGLYEIIKGVSFAESIEVRDPYHLQKIKKEVKPYMVDNLRQFFEKQLIMAPEHDEELYMQIISYVVARQTQLGRPVFESKDRAGDHALDALMLACLAITQNYGELLRMNIATDAFPVSNVNFLPTKELEGDPAQRQRQEEKLVETYGSMTSAPVRIKRSMTASPSRSGGIKRGRF